ncbi:MAG: hypothetical protein ACI4PK_01305, partial [Oscillospiraceae bacterium]
VLDYISCLTKEFNKVTEGHQKKIKELTEQNNTIASEINSKNETIKLLEQEIKTMSARINELNNKEATYNSAIENVGAAMLSIKKTANSLLEEAENKVRIFVSSFSNMKENTCNNILSFERNLKEINTTVNNATANFNDQVESALSSLFELREGLTKMDILNEDFDKIK